MNGGCLFVLIKSNFSTNMYSVDTRLDLFTRGALSSLPSIIFCIC